VQPIHISDHDKVLLDKLLERHKACPPRITLLLSRAQDTSTQVLRVTDEAMTAFTNHVSALRLCDLCEVCLCVRCSSSHFLCSPSWIPSKSQILAFLYLDSPLAAPSSFSLPSSC
jgi:hypothetical protein